MHFFISFYRESYTLIIVVRFLIFSISWISYPIHIWHIKQYGSSPFSNGQPIKFSAGAIIPWIISEIITYIKNIIKYIFCCFIFQFSNSFEFHVYTLRIKTLISKFSTSYPLFWELLKESHQFSSSASQLNSPQFRFSTLGELENFWFKPLYEFHQLLSQPPRDVPGTSPEGPLKVVTSGTSRGLLGDQQKNWWFDEKSVF